MIKKILEKLISSGLSQAEISRRVKVPQPRISDILGDKQKSISYEAGKRIENLAFELDLIKK